MPGNQREHLPRMHSSWMSFPSSKSASGRRESSAIGSRWSVFRRGMCLMATKADVQASSKRILIHNTPPSNRYYTEDPCLAPP